MGERFVFISPGVKIKEKDLTNYRRTGSRPHGAIVVGSSIGGGGTPTPEDSMLQWITGVMYNTGVLMYNYKIWTNN